MAIEPETYDDAPVGSPPEKDVRQEYITELMRRGRYRRTLTARSLAGKWGIGYRTLENDASDAARLLRIAPEQREAYQAESMAWYENLAEEARTTAHSVTGMVDFSAAIKARAEALKCAGVRLDDPADGGSRGPVTIRVVCADEPALPVPAEPALPPK